MEGKIYGTLMRLVYESLQAIDRKRKEVMAKSHHRGHEIYWNDKEQCWKFSDLDMPVENWPHRPCVKCKKCPTKEGYDACLGHLKGVKHACCGHGVTKKTIIY